MTIENAMIEKKEERNRRIWREINIQEASEGKKTMKQNRKKHKWKRMKRMTEGKSQNRKQVKKGNRKRGKKRILVNVNRTLRISSPREKKNIETEMKART